MESGLVCSLRTLFSGDLDTTSLNKSPVPQRPNPLRVIHYDVRRLVADEVSGHLYWRAGRERIPRLRRVPRGSCGTSEATAVRFSRDLVNFSKGIDMSIGRCSTRLF